MKRFILLFMGCFFILHFASPLEAGTVRFPVEVRISTGAEYLVDTEIFVINLKNNPVTFSFKYYNHLGERGSCPYPESITLEGNQTWSFSLGGCFAVAIPMPAFNWIGFGEITAPSKRISVYWRIYDVSGKENILLDHGKETP